ncbi:hypothetical protein KJ885_01650 [Patescibacteria group bacterium]|nr:hypothetical protein [Patescibacteria group bacterium]
MIKFLMSAFLVGGGLGVLLSLASMDKWDIWWLWMLSFATFGIGLKLMIDFEIDEKIETAINDIIDEKIEIAKDEIMAEMECKIASVEADMARIEMENTEKLK